MGSYWPYAPILFDYIRRTMPFGNAQSLTNDELYAVTAYVLFLNDVIKEESFELNRNNLASSSCPTSPTSSTTIANKRKRRSGTRLPA